VPYQQNVTSEVIEADGKRLLVIEVNLDLEPWVSSSGKSQLLATGNVPVSIPGRDGFKLSLNVYRPFTKVELVDLAKSRA
jgi:hypothetical protein